MQKTSEWLISFGSECDQQISKLVNDRKEQSQHSHFSLGKQATTISVTGGKGGVGKTSVSLKLAKELSRRGERVLLIDCDYNLSNTSIKLGLPVSNTFYSLVSAEKSFDECLHKDGLFHLLSACNGSIDLFDANFRLEEIVIDIINEHQDEYDFILLDCPAGLMRETLTLNAYCDQRILVVTPDRASITDSYSLIKVLSHKFGIRENQLLVNMVSSHSQFERVVKTMSETVENFLGGRTQVLGSIKKLNIGHSRFDDFFLAPGKNDHHQNFCKVVNRLTDKLNESRISAGLIAQKSQSLLEQEVR